MRAGNKHLYSLGRLKAGERNKTEAAYELELEAQKQAGLILWYQFEGIKFRLADNCFFTPDFVVMLANGELECREVKGAKTIFIGDSKVKLRMASELFPIRFVAIYPVAKKDGGGWKMEEF